METFDEKQHKTSIKSTVQIAAFMVILTLISKGLGFIREIFMAGCFGTSYIVDAYVMAQTAPGIIIGGLFISIGTAYIPLFSQKVENEGSKEGNKFTNQVICLACSCALVIFILGFIFSDEIVNLIAYKFDGKTAELTSFYLKIAFSYMIFTSVAEILEAFLRYRGVFLAPIIVGYFQNFAVIGMIVISKAIGYKYLAFGALVGYLIRLVADVLLVRKQSFAFHVCTKFGSTAKEILALSFPVFIGTSINQINTFVDKSLASGLSEGSIAALNYGNLITTTIIGLTITIITTIIYPRMAQAQVQGNYEHFNSMVSTGFNLICLISVPFSLGAMLYSDQIVQIIYERGAFDPSSTGLTSVALLYYGAGMIFVSMNQLFAQAYYSMHDMKTPVICGAVGVAVNITLNLILIRYMAHGGLALATSVAAMVNAVMLYYMMCKKHPDVTVVKSRRKAVRIALAAVISVAASATCYYLVIMPLAHIIYMRTVQLGLAVGVAVVVYYLLLRKMKIEELELIWGLFGRKKR